MMQVDTMAKKMLIDANHAEETRVVVVDGNKVEEFDFESQNKRQLAGNIYLAKVTRVEPSLQAAFVDYGGNRHGFLAFSEIHPDYYQIPIADREALKAEEKAYENFLAAEADREEVNNQGKQESNLKSAIKENVDPIKVREVTSTVDTVIEDTDNPEIEKPDNKDELKNGSELIADGEKSNISKKDELTEVDETGDGANLIQIEKNNKDEHAKFNDPADEEKNLDQNIESVAQEDDSDDVRPVRKPRTRRYKIQEVVKVRQVMLIQVAKEERGNKGAALTTYLSLAGRYCVLMPNTARGGGISRKITNASDRKKLKEISTTIEVPDGAGLIVRTAGAKRTKLEIKRDYEYLQRMWEQIRELTLKSTAPSAIYEEGDLIKRSIRDLYNRDIDEILVAGIAGYQNAKNTMKMMMPSHTKNVKHYVDAMPLFARFQVEAFMDGMFNPTVQLKSGGYLVIGITEALVAVDVNSGRATKEGSVEQTALNTNLEAAEEVARQLRLRDLAGLIVIDFIDMEERRNNSAVEKRLKDKLRTDRARIQVGRISGFGLMEMSRQRLRPGMLEASTQPCTHCHGTGLIRSQDSLGLTILRELEEEGVRGRSKEVLIKAPISIANFLINEKREHISHLEQRHGMAVKIESDPNLVSPDFNLEKFKVATRIVPEVNTTVSSLDVALMEEVDEEVQGDPAQTEQVVLENETPRKRRRRRRRRRNDNLEEGKSDEVLIEPKESQNSDKKIQGEESLVQSDESLNNKPKRRTRKNVNSKSELSVSAKSNNLLNDAETTTNLKKETQSEDIEKSQSELKNKLTKPKRTPRPRKTKSEKEAEKIDLDQVKEIAPVEDVKKKKTSSKVKKKPVSTSEVTNTVSENLRKSAVDKPTINETEKPQEAKKRGWWSRS